MLQWIRGRLLGAYGNVSYGYNSDGIRVEKTVNGVLHKYCLEGDRIHKEHMEVIPYGITTRQVVYQALSITVQDTITRRISRAI